MGGVETPDVCRGIGLGIAKGLGVSQHRRKTASPGFHLAENEVAGSVENSGKGGNIIPDKRFPQHLDGRSPAHHGGLEQQGNP